MLVSSAFSLIVSFCVLSAFSAFSNIVGSSSIPISSSSDNRSSCPRSSYQFILQRPRDTICVVNSLSTYLSSSSSSPYSSPLFRSSCSSKSLIQFFLAEGIFEESWPGCGSSGNILIRYDELESPIIWFEYLTFASISNVLTIGVSPFFPFLSCYYVSSVICCSLLAEGGALSLTPAARLTILLYKLAWG